MAVRDDSAGRRRVTLVTSSLDVGGASRVMTILANAWAAAGQQVTIIALDWVREPFFPLEPRVDVRHLDLLGTSTGPVAAVLKNLRRVVALRRSIRSSEPDVVVSFGDRTNVRCLLATIRQPWPVVVADRTAEQPMSGLAWRWLRRRTYRRADGFVLQTEAMTREVHGKLRDRVTVIPNPVPDLSDEPPGPRGAADGIHRVVGLGRLVPQKGFDTLIDAFAIVAARDPDAILEIWGAGPEEVGLRGRIRSLQLEGRVVLAGQTERPDEVLRSATVYVLSSRMEGFPNVLLEAMALGRPVVAVDCRFGPAEIVRHGVDGYLVPPGDTPALAEAIMAVLASPTLRTSLGARAIEVRTRFALEGIVERWDQLIAAVIRRRNVP